LIDELIPRAPVSLRALDVGCGEGSLLTALQRAGWEATGVEWDPRAAEIARRQSGRPVHPGDFRRIDLPGGAYHLVALSHVLEHLGDPVSALRRIEEFLAPGGRAVLLYPNPESLGARVFRDAWFPWEVPRHLVLPSSRALAREAWRAGLTVERIRTTARFAPNFFARSRKYRSARPGEPIDVTVSVLDHAAGLLERLLVALGLNLGEEVVVSLVKPASPEDSIPHAPGTPRG
jgi:SAM-dependent methyltransferase